MGTGDAGAKVDTEAVEPEAVDTEAVEQSRGTETKRPGTCWFPHACVRSLVWVAAVSTSVTRLLHVCECEAAANQLRNVSTSVTAAAKQLRKQVHVCYTSATRLVHRLRSSCGM